MLDAPVEEIEVESLLKKHRGISANNPYLQPTPMMYIHEIRPAAIAERVITAAIEIAEEWEADLQLLETEAEQLWARHRDEVKSLDESSLRMPVFEHDPDNNVDSAFRGGNYDLIQALATREAARRLMIDLRTQPSRAAERDMFTRFCSKDSPWAGELPRNSADIFLRKLIDEPAAISLRAGASKPSFVDPLRVAGSLLEHRRQLVAEWCKVLSNAPTEIQLVRRKVVVKNLEGLL